MSDVIDLDIELHFMDDEELPEDERIDQDVRIVSVVQKGEFFIETELGEDDKIVINAGPLKVKVDRLNFLKAYVDYTLGGIKFVDEKTETIK